MKQPECTNDAHPLPTIAPLLVSPLSLPKGGLLVIKHLYSHLEGLEDIRTSHQQLPGYVRHPSTDHELHILSLHMHCITL